MNGVPARGQLLAQLRADNPAAAVGRVDSDADVHKKSQRLPVCGQYKRFVPLLTNDRRALTAEHLLADIARGRRPSLSPASCLNLSHLRKGGQARVVTIRPNIFFDNLFFSAAVARRLGRGESDTPTD
jgi:hypothetical protein